MAWPVAFEEAKVMKLKAFILFLLVTFHLESATLKDLKEKENVFEAGLLLSGLDNGIHFLEPEDDILTSYGIAPNEYFLSITRLEPENNLEIMFDAYIAINSQYPYYVIGNHTTSYGDYLKDKYRNKGIIFLGGIFKKKDLDNIRYYSKLYLHGHSVGGTNPSLLEAMAAKTLIIAHNNKFNISVLGDDAFYFSSSDDLIQLFKQDLAIKKEKFVYNNLDKINKLYRWSIIVDQYEEYFKSILINNK